MRYRCLPDTSIEANVACLGTMTRGGQTTEAVAREQPGLALETGISFIDTAEMYPIPPARRNLHSPRNIDDYRGNHYRPVAIQYRRH